MEQETGAAAKGKDSNDDQNAPDPSSLTGKKEDQDQQKEEKRELEKLNEDLRKRLETNERWSFGEVCRPKEISTQRSPDAAPEVEELYKRTASVEERFPTQALSASTSSDAEWRRMSKEVSEPQPLFHSPRMTLHTLEMLHAELRRMSEEVAQPQPLLNFPRMPFPTLEKLDLEPSPATGCTDVSTIPVKSDKDKGPCHITGMVAISGTQLMLADKINKCMKLLDLETGTVIGVKGLPSAPHDVTCVPGSRVAVTIPAFHQIHVFTADRDLKQCGIMKVDGFCSGIHCSGDRFFVSFEDTSLVQIMNMEGDIIKTIKLDSIEYPMSLT